MIRSTQFFTIVFLCVLGLFFGVDTGDVEADLVGAWLFDETSGDAAIDSSEHGNDGVLVGAPDRVDGKFGGGLKGEPDKYVDFPAPTPEVLLLERDFTVMAWFQAHAWVPGWNCIFSMQAGSGGGETYGIYLSNRPGEEIMLWSRVGTGSVNVRGGQGSLDLEEWAHGTVTYDGSQLTLYKNGEELATNAMSGDLDNGDGQGRLVINGNYNSLNGGLGEFVSATIDEVLIFDEVLSVEDIQEYVNVGFDGVHGTAVEAQGKLAVTWGQIKDSR